MQSYANRLSATNSRLLGNFIGNSGRLGTFGESETKIIRQVEMLMPKFSVQRNRELRKANRDFETRKRAELEGQNLHGHVTRPGSCGRLRACRLAPATSGARSAKPIG